MSPDQLIAPLESSMIGLVLCFGFSGRYDDCYLAEVSTVETYFG